MARYDSRAPLANVALALEYEATCRLAEHWDLKAFDRLMRRKGGEAPLPDDTIA